MDEPAAHPEGLSLGQDLRFERRWWVFQRVMWALSLVLVALGALGAFGRGALSQRELLAATFRIKFSKVERLFNPSELEIRLARGGSPKSNVELTISEGYETCVSVDGAKPKPVLERLDPTGRTLSFAVQALDREKSIRLALKPRRTGRCAGRFTLDGDGLEIAQVVLP